MLAGKGAPSRHCGLRGHIIVPGRQRGWARRGRRERLGQREPAVQGRRVAGKTRPRPRPAARQGSAATSQAARPCPCPRRRGARGAPRALRTVKQRLFREKERVCFGGSAVRRPGRGVRASPAHHRALNMLRCPSALTLRMLMKLAAVHVPP